MSSLAPPIEPMLAQLSHDLPAFGHVYEPKWDGFRCLAFVRGGTVDLRSRHQRPLSRYFPELVEGLRGMRGEPFVIDGEIVIAGPHGFDFPALLGRVHPAASRVERLRRESPATLVAFDLLEADGEDLRARTFEHRRARLAALMEGAPPSIVLTPATDQAEIARDWLERYDGTGIDGVVAKRLDLLYQPGRRAMIKVKKERTADCVVAGVRVALDGGEASVASLLLGLYDGGSLRHVGVCSTFTALRRRELFAELRPRIVPLEGHPWERGFNLGRSPTGRLKGSAGRWDPAEMTQDWVPVEPDLVCEVRYDRLDADRFRHPAKFLRWRPDREAGSCRFEQFAGRAPRDGAADRTSEPPWS